MRAFLKIIIIKKKHDTEKDQYYSYHYFYIITYHIRKAGINYTCHLHMHDTDLNCQERQKRENCCICVACSHAAVMLLSHTVSGKKLQQLQVAHSNRQTSATFAPVCLFVWIILIVHSSRLMWVFQLVHAMQDLSKSSC